MVGGLCTFSCQTQLVLSLVGVVTILGMKRKERLRCFILALSFLTHHHNFPWTVEGFILSTLKKIKKILNTPA